MPGIIAETVILALCGALAGALGWKLGDTHRVTLGAAGGAVAALSFAPYGTFSQAVAVVAIGALAYGASTDARTRTLYDVPTVLALVVGGIALYVDGRHGTAAAWFLGAIVTTLPFAALAFRSGPARVPWGDILYTALCGALAGPIYGPCGLIAGALLARSIGGKDDRPWAVALALGTTFALAARFIFAALLTR